MGIGSCRRYPLATAPACSNLACLGTIDRLPTTVRLELQTLASLVVNQVFFNASLVPLMDKFAFARRSRRTLAVRRFVVVAIKIAEAPCGLCWMQSW